MRTLSLILALAACVADADTDTDVEMVGIYAVAASSTPEQAVGAETMTYTLDITTTEDGAVVEGATVELVPWMPGHAHGISDTVVVTEIGGGEYEAAFEYSMPGAWELQIHITSGDVEDDVLVPITVL